MSFDKSLSRDSRASQRPARLLTSATALFDARFNESHPSSVSRHHAAADSARLSNGQHRHYRSGRALARPGSIGTYHSKRGGPYVAWSRSRSTSTAAAQTPPHNERTHSRHKRCEA